MECSSNFFKIKLLKCHGVGRLTLRTRKLWLVGWRMSRPTATRVTFDSFECQRTLFLIKERKNSFFFSKKKKTRKKMMKRRTQVKKKKSEKLKNNQRIKINSKRIQKKKEIFCEGEQT